MLPSQSTAQAAPSQVPVGPASGRLKYAEPRDLPSFPSHGLRESDAAASAAASLGWANQKPVEPPKPGEGTAASASAAALLGTESSKTSPLWGADRSDIVSRAAILAAGGAARRQVQDGPGSAPLPLSSTSSWGTSAANQAFKTGAAGRITAEPSSSALLNRRGSLRAAKDAMAAGRPRAISSPTPKPHLLNEKRVDVTDPEPIVRSPKNASAPRTPNTPTNATAALTAATTAHRRTVSVDGAGGAVPYTTMGRQMFTGQPPVESEDQKRTEVLHASAVAMAKRMYSRQNEQQKYAEALRLAREDSPDGPRSPRSPGAAANAAAQSQQPSPLQPVQFGNLQEAAYKLAQDRLAKLQDEHQRGREGYLPQQQQQSPHRRFTILGKLRRRSSSDGVVFENRGRPRRRMSLFIDNSNGPNAAAIADEEKRQRDRQALLTAARRNVKAQLEGIDRQVYNDTGKASPAMLQSEWEHKARALAKTRSEALVSGTGTGSAGGSGNGVPATRNPNGKVDIGGGKFMDQREIDDIAARRVQPYLDEINEKAEKERERLAALRVEEENRRRELELKRAQDKEVKEMHEKLKAQQKDQDKLRKEELKQEDRARKEAEKEAKAETKREAREERRASKDLALAIPPPAEREVIAASAENSRTTTTGMVPAPASQPAEESLPPTKEKEKGPRKLAARASRLHLRLPSLSKHQSATAKEKEPEHPRETQPKSPLGAAGPDLAENESPTSKVKNWLKSHLRPRAKSSPEQQSGVFSTVGGGTTSRDRSGTSKLRRRRNRGESAAEAEGGGFIGGAALAAAHNREANASTNLAAGGDGSSSSSLPSTNDGEYGQQPRSSSIYDVALAGRRVEREPEAAPLPPSAATAMSEGGAAGSKARSNGTAAASVPGPFVNGSVSSLTSSSNNLSSTSTGSTSAGADNFVLAREGPSPGPFEPPRPIRDPAALGTARATKTGSPVRNSRFLEMMK